MYGRAVNPSTRAVANVGRRPTFEAGAFVAPNASVIGDVKVGKGSSIWYGATVRGTTAVCHFVALYTRENCI